MNSVQLQFLCSCRFAASSLPVAHLRQVLLVCLLLRRVFQFAVVTAGVTDQTYALYCIPDYSSEDKQEQIKLLKAEMIRAKFNGAQTGGFGLELAGPGSRSQMRDMKLQQSRSGQHGSQLSGIVTRYMN